MRTHLLTGRRASRSISLVVLILLVGGCRQSDRSETAPVTGTVTYAGDPLKKGTIIFETAGARPAYGKIVEGKIVEVTTYEPDDGAPVGKHHVAIQAVTPLGGSSTAGSTPAGANANPMRSMTVKSLIPQRYGNPATSDLTAEVKADTKNHFTFALTK